MSHLVGNLDVGHNRSLFLFLVVRVVAGIVIPLKKEYRDEFTGKAKSPES